MIITSTNIAMASDRRLEISDSRTERLRIWIDAPAPAPADDKVTLTPQAQQASLCELEEAAADDPKLTMIRTLIEALTGRKIRFLRAEDLQPAAAAPAPPAMAPEGSSQGPQRVGWGISYDMTESHTEAENTNFQAAGIIRTSDGKEIQFTLAVQIARSFTSSASLSFRAGDALIDPLVVNFNGPASLLADQRFSFDLNADGASESLPYLRGGSGYLAFDANGDGLINNGRELFGPRTGDGFAELAAYDEDGNGWIDEGDAAYRNLAVWTIGEDGTETISGLKSNGIGAIFTGSADTAFSLKDDQNATRGRIRSTGLYLTESGKAGSIQQLDLAV